MGRVQRIEVWAPRARRVAAVVDGRDLGMTALEDGWWELPAGLATGADYAFRLDGDDAALPDPRSRRQPHGVHRPSRVDDPCGYAWHDQGWGGRDLVGGLVYELHVGTFTPEGTLDAVAGRLDHLVGLGVSHVELMPVNAFGGRHGWGYDGVALYAVHEPYGGPDGLRRLVDACHRRGLAVVLDVVYNHLGPSGNYLSHFGPYFTDRHTTPWGQAINLDDDGCPVVRRFVVDNALMWLRDFHVDGLRIDAVHALADDSPEHLLAQLSREVEALSAELGRPLSLIAESDENDPRTVLPRDVGGLGMTAQWSDDFHHALHGMLTGERQGYYVDFGSLPTVAKTLTEVFLHDGSWSTFRGRPHGGRVDPARVPGWRYLGYLQDHDQVGNRATGDRISASVSSGLLRVGAALVLTSPFTPMLFMGEEWAASTPWQFFSDHEEPELAEAIRDGRRAEFADHGWAADDVPDPQDPATFERSVLEWAEPAAEPHASMLAWYRSLVRLRADHPDLRDARLDRVRVAYDEAGRWPVVTRGSLRVACNLADVPQRVPLDAAPAEVLLASGSARLAVGAIRLDAESVAIVRAGGRA
jgi:maltooligosyltrehalose trehalohydrolase